MQLYNPSNVKLPPLVIEKFQEREEMENSPKISNFIRSNLLLNKAFHTLFQEMNKKSEAIDQHIKAIQEVLHSHQMFLPPLHSQGHDIEDYMLRDFMLLRHGTTRRGVGAKRKAEFERAMREIGTVHNKRNISSIKRHSTEIQNLLSRFEQSNGLTLDILTPHTLYICRKCFNVLSTDRFQVGPCRCGLQITTTANTRTEPVAYFDARMRGFITHNYWFEYGVDYLLKRKNFQTLCGVHVLGHSGCMHEIDNIAESRTSNFRIFCECKTAEVKTSDVFVFAGKMADVGCTRAYVFTVTKDIPRQIVHLARSRNISMITSALDRPMADLIKEIKED